MRQWLAPPLLPALLVMVLFVFVDRRRWYVLVPAVVGWAAVWVDNRLTGDWLDVVGIAVVVASLVVLWLTPRDGEHSVGGDPGP